MHLRNRLISQAIAMLILVGVSAIASALTYYFVMTSLGEAYRKLTSTVEFGGEGLATSASMVRYEDTGFIFIKSSIDSTVRVHIWVVCDSESVAEKEYVINPHGLVVDNMYIPESYSLCKLIVYEDTGVIYHVFESK